jgi:hypothetical protein
MGGNFELSIEVDALSGQGVLVEPACRGWVGEIASS